ncbi:MAG TPA: protein kinase [Thermoanaerobaculia bacterium]
MIGGTLSHYRILERLGGGGMGVVYKAVDLKLDRPVALKFLAGQRGASEEHKRRFMREARAASALDHPNICTIYEIDESGDGALFIAMAFCEGEALRERLDRGPLPVAEALGIAEQIAAGLGAAHERGIVHRDVKPANVMLTSGGRVKLVDFGIAKLDDQSRLTRAGMTLGTAAYMSPEQFHGEDAGPRTDVWSLGVVIYEMVTGHLPFDGADEMEIVRGIVKRPPRPMAGFRPGVPPALERIVARALEKSPERRFRSMADLRADLLALAAAMAAPRAEEDLDRTLFELPLPARPLPPTASLEAGAGLLGQMIGSYEILEILGGGGMGVIYKGRDARLARTVALKFLPPELTRDPESKERFVQEARAASSLDHPNLCTILEMGETPDGRLYLAMPCYDGETLRRRIERGPLPTAEAVDLATQIARGLSKAHRSGIVHRDVKPANVIVTADGVVKILDFGLAKLAGSAALPQGSQAGSSAGTPAYMSPEQARGDEVDARTDLWSLGVVLYEMLAGRRPFRGEREQAVVYAILNERPEPLRELRPEVPAELARIVERLMAKEPAARYATVDEPLAELRALQNEAGTTTLRAALPRRALRPWAWAALALLAAVGLAIYWLPARGAKEDAPIHAAFARLTDLEGSETFPSVSPDGNFFVFAKATSGDNFDLYLQRVQGGNPIDLTADSPVSDTQPAYSPDGQQIAFRSEREGGGIFLMGATGESVRRLAGFGYNPAWSPDGKEIAVATEGVSDPRVRKTSSQIWSVEVATGVRRLVAGGDAVQPSWSPHGQRLAFWGLPSGSSRRVLWTVAAAGGAPAPVLDDEHLNWDPVWSPDGRYLYFASNRSGSMNLWRLPIDEPSGKALGPPEPITAPAEWNGLLSLSRDGRHLLYATNESKANLESVALDARGVAAGPLKPLTQGSRGIRSCDVSPDGAWVAFHASIPQEDLFVIHPDGSGLRQLTDDAFRDRYPRWSPDGRRLAFQSDRSGRNEIWSLRAEGGDLQQVTRTSGNSPTYPLWSPDGRRIACAVATRGTALIDLTRPLEERRLDPLPPVTGDGQLFDASSWSPDGSRLAGTAQLQDKKSLPGIVLYSLAARTYERLTDRGQSPRWFPDGGTLLFRDQGRIYALDVRSRQIREVLAPPASSSFIAHAASPDGRALYVARATEGGHICMLTLQ